MGLARDSNSVVRGVFWKEGRLEEVGLRKVESEVRVMATGLLARGGSDFSGFTC